MGTIKREQDLKNIAYDLQNLFYEELNSECEEKKPHFKKRIKVYLYKWYEIAEFQLNLKGETLNKFCIFLNYIYNKVLEKVNEYKLE